jgi:hypothetical protein
MPSPRGCPFAHESSVPRPKVFINLLVSLSIGIVFEKQALTGTCSPMGNPFPQPDTRPMA